MVALGEKPLDDHVQGLGDATGEADALWCGAVVEPTDTLSKRVYTVKDTELVVAVGPVRVHAVPLQELCDHGSDPRCFRETCGSIIQIYALHG